jgi:hypothetical protein
MFPHLQRSLENLKPWLDRSDSYTGNRNHNDHLDNENFLLMELFSIEQHMAVVTIRRRDFETAEGHCQRCLTYSERLRSEGEVKTTFMFTALRTYCSLRDRQCNYSDALTFAEEGYNLVVVAYDCVHPQVQEAAGILMNILTRNNDVFNAERYAQITYSNLRDSKNGMDQEGEEIAMGSHDLADCIFFQRGDLLKAERLAKEAIRIRSINSGVNHGAVGRSSQLLANILRVQDKLGDQTRVLFERSLAIFLRNEGPDGLNTAAANTNIGLYYDQLARHQPTATLTRTKLLLGKSHLEESLRIHSKIYRPNHPDTIYAASRLFIVLSQISRI